MQELTHNFSDTVWKANEHWRFIGLPCGQYDRCTAQHYNVPERSCEVKRVMILYFTSELHFLWRHTPLSWRFVSEATPVYRWVNHHTQPILSVSQLSVSRTGLLRVMWQFRSLFWTWFVFSLLNRTGDGYRFKSVAGSAVSFPYIVVRFAINVALNTD